MADTYNQSFFLLTIKFKNMKRNYTFLLFGLLFISMLSMTSCTKNYRVRMLGGTQEIGLKPNEVLVNITWKDNDMWVLTKDTLTNVSYFRESSSFGVWNGEVIIK